MELTINVQLSASPELSELLKMIAGAIGSAGNVAPAKTKKQAAAASASTEPETPVIPIKKEEVSASAESENDEPITFTQVRALAAEKSTESEAKKAQVKNIMTEMGVEKLSALKEEQYPEFMQKLKAL